MKKTTEAQGTVVTEQGNVVSAVDENGFMTFKIPAKLDVTFTWAHEKGAASRNAKMVIDISKLDSADVESYLVDTLVIKKQGQLRRVHGTEKWAEPKKDDQGVELHEMVADKPGARKNADPTKKAVTDGLKALVEKGLSMQDILAMVEAVKNNVK